MRLFGLLGIEIRESLEHDRGDVGNFEKHLVEKRLAVWKLLRRIVVLRQPYSNLEDLEREDFFLWVGD